MVESYLAGDLQALEKQVDDQLAELPPDARRYFMSQGMFVAVGALHLPGGTGLIASLRQRGYELKPLPLPFSAPQKRGESEHGSDHETADTP
jgi:hypothetical protein